MSNETENETGAETTKPKAKTKAELEAEVAAMQARIAELEAKQATQTVIGPGTPRNYAFREYPKTLFHESAPTVGRTVKDYEEEQALGPGWADSPAKFKVETAPGASQ